MSTAPAMDTCNLTSEPVGISGDNFYIDIKTTGILFNEFILYTGSLWQLINYQMTALTSCTFGHVCQIAY